MTPPSVGSIQTIQLHPVNAKFGVPALNVFRSVVRCSASIRNQYHAPPNAVLTAELNRLYSVVKSAIERELFHNCLGITPALPFSKPIY